MTTERSSAGSFHPVSAFVYGPKREILASGEAGAEKLVLILQTRIKPPRALFTQERTNQNHAQSVSDLALEVRNQGGGDKLVGSMEIHHDGRIYQIRGLLSSNWIKGTTVYQVVVMNDFVQS